MNENENKCEDWTRFVISSVEFLHTYTKGQAVRQLNILVSVFIHVAIL